MPTVLAVAAMEETVVEAAEARLAAEALMSSTWTGTVYETKRWKAAYEAPKMNCMICMVVRFRLSIWGMGTEKAVRV